MDFSVDDHIQGTAGSAPFLPEHNTATERVCRRVVLPDYLLLPAPKNIVQESEGCH
ncbi:MAG: hypothetical protein WD317_06400 [Balneolaceae bacterium]